MRWQESDSLKRQSGFAILGNFGSALPVEHVRNHLDFCFGRRDLLRRGGLWTLAEKEGHDGVTLYCAEETEKICVSRFSYLIVLTFVSSSLNVENNFFGDEALTSAGCPSLGFPSRIESDTVNTSN